MSASTQMKAVVEGLAGRTMTNQEIESVITNYNAAFGNDWFVSANPYDQQAQPVLWASWPDNATGDELATFALASMRQETKELLRHGRRARFERQRKAAEESAANEL